MFSPFSRSENAIIVINGNFPSLLNYKYYQNYNIYTFAINFFFSYLLLMKASIPESLVGRLYRINTIFVRLRIRSQWVSGMDYFCCWKTFVLLNANFLWLKNIVGKVHVFKILFQNVFFIELLKTSMNKNSRFCCFDRDEYIHMENLTLSGILI